MQIKIQRWRPNWFALLITEYSTCNFGHFAVMAILSLYFVGSLHLPPTQAGGLLLFVSLSFRLSRVFIAPLIDRFPIHQATFMALFLTGFSYLGMSVVRTPLLIMALLLTAGIGHGTNSLLVKTLAASSSRLEAKSLFFRYASLTTGINLAAAIGAFVGSTLLFHWSANVVFLFAAIAYILAGLVATSLPSKEFEQHQRPKWRTGLHLSLRRLPLWRAMLFAFMGWFLYTQSYASLPLFVSDAVRRPDLLGSVFALNAVLVVVGQVPVSRLVMHLRMSIAQIVILAFLSFACGFALLWFFPLWQVVYAAVTLWTLGEILLMPALDTLVAEGALVEHKQVAFTLNAVAVSLGEGIGNLIGVSGAESLLNSGDLRYLYTFFTAGAICAMVMTIVLNRRKQPFQEGELMKQS
ncbi:MAG TPA: MFS transporter [Ktedonosporobacter sp.]|jgi:predicted MFS family arabinose efflux permease|nr:MFS transporter [Ktedonosporobacter sp.]